MTRLLLALPLLCQAALLWPGAARAETHAVTIRNGGPETIRGIYFGGSGESRLRRELPQGAEARITYSTSCRTDIRIAYSSGRTEDHPGVEVCTDPRIVAGTDGTPGTPMPATATTTAAGARSTSTSRPTAATGATAATAAAAVVKAPPPVVPPWTGKSITKRFGGME